ncbi:MAG: hypothetical protein IKK87_01940 [Bacteroidaceae bacterium]|nr:hypothetical protein [Bacteroidaceae bacterium]
MNLHMNLAPTSVAALHEVLQKIVRLYSGEEDQLVTTDFYFMPVREKGTLYVFNDNDEEIAQTTVLEWADYTDDAFYDAVGADLIAAIQEVNAEGDLERLAVWMPYSFVLVDGERETVADLLLVDDDALLVTDSLLQGLDEELNRFLEELMAE